MDIKHQSKVSRAKVKIKDQNTSFNKDFKNKIPFGLRGITNIIDSIKDAR